MQSVLGAFLVQARVIWALVLREMQTRYGRENLGFLWIIGEPILFTGGVTIAWSIIRPPHEHGLPVTAFTVTGYVPLTLWRHCIGRAVKAFESNGSLLFHRQVSPLDTLVARWILEVVGNLVAALFVAFGAITLGFMDPPKELGLVWLGLAYQALFGLACALLIASLTERSEFAEKMVQVVSYLFIPFSGCFIMVSFVPEHYRWILLLSPSVHSTEMIRAGYFGSAVHAIYDPVYMTWINGLLLVLGLSMTLRSRRYILVQ